MRYLGIDYGTKKVGLALSDEGGTMGFPHSIVPNDPHLLETVRVLVEREHVAAIVIGDSVDFAGKENKVAQQARTFGAHLHQETGRPLFYEVEILTTQEASRAMDGTHPKMVSNSVRQRVVKGLWARGKGHETADSSAAALILTSYLSRHHD
jgi:putative Holliday junction resolvase